ncbi:MAG: hypothetical protein KDA84_21815 [Planctomycetaceae bacterium]|nr:hypothetical protein [Planctomycetaceae bacterium]
MRHGWMMVSNALRGEVERAAKGAVAASALSRQESQTESQPQPLNDFMRPIARQFVECDFVQKSRQGENTPKKHGKNGTY